jgi:hypothetical protein
MFSLTRVRHISFFSITTTSVVTYINLVYSQIRYMSPVHKFFDFESKKFVSYSNEFNKIILVNYNL